MTPLTLIATHRSNSAAAIRMDPLDELFLFGGGPGPEVGQLRQGTAVANNAMAHGTNGPAAAGADSVSSSGPGSGSGAAAAAAQERE